MSARIVVLLSRANTHIDTEERRALITNHNGASWTSFLSFCWRKAENPISRPPLLWEALAPTSSSVHYVTELMIGNSGREEAQAWVGAYFVSFTYFYCIH